MESNDLPELYHGIASAGNRYAMAMLATWREAKARAANPNWIAFTKERLVHHGIELHRLKITDKTVSVKNVPDTIYTYRAREDLPTEITDQGQVAIIGDGRGRYVFAKIPRPNRFALPKISEEKIIKESVPKWARPYMGDDEQGTLTRVAANHLVKDYLGLSDAFRLQSHLRMGVPKYGQVEVDEVYVGINASGAHEIIGVEAKDKGMNDLLNVSQLFGTSQALLHIFPELPFKRLLGVKPDAHGRICICEFRVAKTPDQIETVGQWKAYVVRESD